MNRFRLVELRNPSEQARASLVHVADVCCLLSAVCGGCSNERTAGRRPTTRGPRALHLPIPIGAEPPRACLVLLCFFSSLTILSGHWLGKEGGETPREVPDLRLISG